MELKEKLTQKEREYIGYLLNVIRDRELLNSRVFQAVKALRYVLLGEDTPIDGERTTIRGIRRSSKT